MSNRPMFDDDNLPLWLTSAGITGGGDTGASVDFSPGPSPAAEAPAQPAGSNDLSWMDSAWENQGQSAQSPGEAESSTLPWFSSDIEDQASFSAPEDTPWISDIGPGDSSTSAVGQDSGSTSAFDSDVASSGSELHKIPPGTEGLPNSIVAKT